MLNTIREYISFPLLLHPFNTTMIHKRTRKYLTNRPSEIQPAVVATMKRSTGSGSYPLTDLVLSFPVVWVVSRWGKSRGQISREVA